MKQHKKVSFALLTIPMVCCFSCTKPDGGEPQVPVIPPHEHVFSETYSSDATKHWQNATCEHTELVQNLGDHVFVDGVCSVCDYVKEIEHVHTFSEKYSRDETSHWRVATCEHTTLTSDFGHHTFVNGVCSTCGFIQPVPAHVHTFNIEYSHDETSHWQAATCEHSELTQNLGLHTYVNGYCSVCGFKEPEPDPEPHVHTFNTEYSHDDTSHWQAATCEHSELTQNLGLHIFEDGVCSVCGFKEPEPPHVHTFSEEYIHDEVSHWQVATCEHSELTQNLGSHTFENGVCTLCGYIDPNSIVHYDEEPDSLDGVDQNDLSHLYGAFEKIGENYTLTNRAHFSEAALELYKEDYKGKEFSQKTTRLFDKNYCYTYSNDELYSSLTEYNKLYIYDEEVTNIAYPEVDILNADSYVPNLLDDDGLSPFKLSDIDATYFLAHTFKRVSKYKYISEDLSVINDFLDLCCPYLDNEGYYMTYNKVSIEVDNYDAITRIRLYASSTQRGKLTENFINEEYENWYLLFNETIVKNIGKTHINCLEKPN